jgi:hypothetical protein
MSTVGGSYSYNASCDVCGFQFKASELRKRWDGLMVCDEDFETRHVLDFFKNKNDHHPLPFTRPQEVIPAYYTGIYDNALSAMSFTSAPATSAHGGVGFNCLVEGYAYGAKFYVDKTTSGYSSQDNTQYYTIALYGLNERAGGVTTSWTLLHSETFGPPFHNGWNERHFKFPVHLQQYRTYILSRVYTNQAVAGFPPVYTELSLGFGLFQGTDTEYFQHGQYLHRSDPQDIYTLPPTNLYSPSTDSSQLGLDVLFKPIENARIKDDNVGVFDINFATPTWMRASGGRTYEAGFGAYQLSMGFIPQEQRTLEGIRWFNPGSIVNSVRLQIWTNNAVEWDMGSYGLALPGQWNYFPVNDFPGVLMTSQLYYVTCFASSAPTFPTLNNLSFASAGGDAESFNSALHFYNNTYRTVYGNPDTGVVSSFIPYLIDVVSGPTIL